MKILGIGLNGLVGSRITELLSGTYEFENISRSTGVDITNRDQVMSTVSASAAAIILHLAAKTQVDRCEEDKEQGESGEAWQINVTGTQHVADAARETGKKMIYISTDFVFDGEKEFYTEDDTPHAINWYGETKLQGENVVQEKARDWLIIRLAYPYRGTYEKIDFMRVIKKRLEENQPVAGVTDHYFTPTFIDDFVSVLHMLIKNNASGIYHAAGGNTLTPYDAAQVIAETFGLSKELITQTTRAEYFRNKAARPFRLALRNDKITKLGIKMKSFEEGLQEIKNQMSKSKTQIKS